MTDQTQRLTVVLDAPHRVDEIDHIVNAITMIKGVTKVGVNVRQPSDYTAEVIAIEHVKKRIQNVLWPPVKES